MKGVIKVYNTLAFRDKFQQDYSVAEKQILYENKQILGEYKHTTLYSKISSAFTTSGTLRFGRYKLYGTTSFLSK